MTELDPVRRVVTGHDDNGRAVIAADEICPHQWEPPDGGTVFEIWQHNGDPDNAKPYEDPIGPAASLPPPPAGTVCRIVDFMPRTDDYVYLHQTASLDYCYVIEGEIHAVLDDSQVLLRVGDMLVQRGTRHGWLNHSGKVCRVLFVLIDAAPISPADHRAG